jgi:6-phosphogluconolactonase (cycloisomerase 2 family)
MTANDTNRVTSDNSVSQSAEGTEKHSEHDVRSRRIVEHAHEHGGTTTRRDLLAQTDLSLDEVNTYLPLLADSGYVDLIGDGDREAILLTCRGGQLAGGTL